jgi:2-methylcitrate dehydratase
LFPEFQPSRVTLTLKDGRSFDKRVDVPKGDPRDPMTMDEIAVKARALGKEIVGEDCVDQIRDCVMNLENENTMERLMELMTA